MPRLEIVQTQKENGIIVSLIGQAGVGNAEALDRALTTLASQRPLVTVFELSELSAVSSLAMGLMVAYRRGVQRYGGAVWLAALQPMVKGAFQHAQLHQILPIVDSVDAALQAAAMPTP